MSTSEFDQKIVSHFEEGELDYAPTQWQNVLQQLEQKEQGKKKRAFILWLPLLGIAASIGVLAVVTIGFHQQTPHTERSITSIQTTTIQKNPPAPSAINTLAPQTQTTQATHITTTKQSAASYTQHIPEKKSITEEPEIKPATAIATTNTQASLAPNIKSEPFITKTNTEPLKPNHDAVAVMPVIAPVRAHERSSISVGGGFNYGKLNTGYTVSTNIRKSIGAKMYVESDFAFVNNSHPEEAYSLSSSSYNSLGTAAPGGSKNIAAAQSMGTPVNNFYHLQFAPSVGYYVHKRIAVGLGADIQRLLQNADNKTTVYEDGELKLLPTYDLGMLAKTEFSMSKNFKTSLIYRAGMNNLTENKYVNRSYFQVQLKLRILGH